MTEPSRRLAAAFSERGWVVIDLAGSAEVGTARHALLGHLRATAAPELDRLEDYHLAVRDDLHDTVLVDLAEWYWSSGLGRRIVEAELAFLRGFVGLDLHVQRYPYLRVVRPGMPGDATGVHRDTLYGASPYEVSMIVPFTDVDADGAVRVLTGSHREPADAYPAVQVESDVVPGSPRHRLGFPYAPRPLDAAVLQRTETVPLQIGQALVISLGLVHGQVENTSNSTRVSTDVRVVNSLAPVSFSRGVRTDYYEPLCASPVTEQARHHDGSAAPGDA